MKTFHDIYKAFLSGAKIRRESWGDKTHYLIVNELKIVDERGARQQLDDDAIFATDWELYEEPAPEPDFKPSLFQFISLLLNQPPTWENGEEICKEIEAEVLRRYYASLPKVGWLTPGQVLLNCSVKKDGNWLNVDLKEAENISARFLSAYQLQQPEPKQESAVERLLNSDFKRIEIQKINLKNNVQCTACVFNGEHFVVGMSDDNLEDAAQNLFEILT